MKKAAVALILILTGHTAFAAPPDSLPPNVTAIPEFETNTRLFLNFTDDFRIMNEVKMRFEDKPIQFRYRSFMTGPYYRVQKNITIGAFYKIQSGFRNLDDWKRNPQEWAWQDSRNRLEHLGVGDVTFRFLLDFLPSDNLVFELKNRFDFNSTTNRHLAIVRPGLNWFWMDGSRPIMNFFLQYEFWLPVGWGLFPDPWETWAYLGFLYHFSPELKIGSFLAWRRTNWTPSQDFLSRFPGEDYQNNGQHDAGVIGFTLLYNLNFDNPD